MVTQGKVIMEIFVGEHFLFDLEQILFMKIFVPFGTFFAYNSTQVTKTTTSFFSTVEHRLRSKTTSTGLNSNEFYERIFESLHFTSKQYNFAKTNKALES